MCLTLLLDNGIKPKMEVAKEDIIVYKVFNLLYDNGDLITPYQKMVMKPNTTYIDTEKVQKTFNGEVDDETNEYRIEGGVFHSYSDELGAEDGVIKWGDGQIVVKCIIPKGTKFYYGYFGGVESFGSKKIIITNEVTYYNEYELRDYLINFGYKLADNIIPNDCE